MSLCIHANTFSLEATGKILALKGNFVVFGEVIQTQNFYRQREFVYY